MTTPALSVGPGGTLPAGSFDSIVGARVDVTFRDDVNASKTRRGTFRGVISHFALAFVAIETVDGRWSFFPADYVAGLEMVDPPAGSSGIDVRA